MFIDVRPLEQKWFAEDLPLNYETASAEIGSGKNGTVKVKYTAVKTDVEIEIVLADKAEADLSAVFNDGVLTVVLGTDDTATPTADDEKNTAKLVAEEISKVNGFTALASGNGSDVIAVTVSNIEFEEGHYGTPALETNVCLYDSATGIYYLATKADGTAFNDGWKQFELEDLDEE